AHLLWVNTGAGELRLGSRVCTLRTGPCFWLYNAQDRIVGPLPGAEFVNTSICFSGPSLEAWLERMGVAQNPEFEFAPKQAARIRALQRRLMRLIHNRVGDWEWEVHVRLNELLRPFLAARAFSWPGTERSSPVVRVLNTIAADPARDWK